MSEMCKLIVRPESGTTHRIFYVDLCTKGHNQPHGGYNLWVCLSSARAGP